MEAKARGLQAGATTHFRSHEGATVLYDNIISRTDAGALLPAEAASEVIKAATAESAALTLCRRAQLSTKVYSQPVLAALPVAYWVSGDTGLKQTTEAAWQGVDLTAEEIACIVPIPEAVLDDSSFDVWGELRDPLAEAVAQVLDAAVFGGINKPASWPQAIVPAALAAGNGVELGTSTPAQGGVVGDIDSAFDVVEADGHTVTGIAAVAAMKGLLRKARDPNGQRLVDPASPTLEGVPLSYLLPGTVPATTRAIVGDFSLAIVGVRQDIAYKVLDQAVLSDDTGKVIFNLAQQDMVALRVTARYAYATANPATRTAAVAPSYPFAVLQDVTPQTELPRSSSRPVGGPVGTLLAGADPRRSLRAAEVGRPVLYRGSRSETIT
jgi:HK97 family phage major capsid protein